MTAKEKADSLLNQYCEIKNITFPLLKERVVLNIARQCALIAIDEIIKANPHSDYKETYPVTHSTIDYWNEVKTELKRMNL